MDLCEFEYSQGYTQSLNTIRLAFYCGHFSDILKLTHFRVSVGM